MRLRASEETRKNRGYIFTPGIDDQNTECALDQFNFDLILNNDSDSCCDLSKIIDFIEKQQMNR